MVRGALGVLFLAVAGYCAYGLSGVTLNRHLDAQLAPTLYREKEAQWLVFDSETRLDLKEKIAWAAQGGKPIFLNFTGHN